MKILAVQVKHVFLMPVLHLWTALLKQTQSDSNHTHTHTHTKSTCYWGRLRLQSSAADVFFGFHKVLIWWVFHGCGPQFHGAHELGCVRFWKEAEGPSYFWCFQLVVHARQSLGFIPFTGSQISLNWMHFPPRVTIALYYNSNLCSTKFTYSVCMIEYVYSDHSYKISQILAKGRWTLCF